MVGHSTTQNQYKNIQMISDTISKVKKDSGILPVKILFLKIKEKLSRIDANDADYKSALMVINFIRGVESEADALTSKFYKTENSGKSIKIVTDNGFSNVVKKTPDSKLRRRFLEKSVKSTYIVKNNANFVRFNLEMDNEITFVSKSDFYEAVLSAIYLIKSIGIVQMRLSPINYTGFGNMRRYATQQMRSRISENPVLYKNKCWTIDTLKGIAEISSGIPSLERTMNKFYIDYRLYVTEPTPENAVAMARLRVDIATEVELERVLPDIDAYNEKLVNGELFSRSNFFETKVVELALNTVKRRGAGAGSAIVSNIFDIITDSEKKMRELSTTSLIEEINPITGFKSIKSVRIPKSELSEHERVFAEKEIKSHLEIMRTTEELSNVIQREIAERKVLESKQFSIISGSAIVAAYNSSSYIEMGKKGDRLFSSSGGTIHSSCMRHSSSKEKIDFYARNESFVKLLVFSENGDKKISGRAILWYDKYVDKYYVDRIYYDSQKTYNKIKAYIGTKKNFIGIHDTSGEQRKEFAIRIDELKSSLDLPYLDSMSKYLLFGEKTKKMFIGSKEEAKSIALENVIQSKIPLGSSNVVYNQEAPSFDLNSSDSSTNNTCVFCGSHDVVKIKSNIGRFSGHDTYVCKHGLVKVGGVLYTTENGGLEPICRVSDNKSKEEYVFNPFSISRKFTIAKKESTTTYAISGGYDTVLISGKIMRGVQINTRSDSASLFSAMVGDNGGIRYTGSYGLFNIDFSTKHLVYDNTVRLSSFMKSSRTYKLIVPTKKSLDFLDKETLLERVRASIVVMLLRGDSETAKIISDATYNGEIELQSETPGVKFIDGAPRINAGGVIVSDGRRIYKSVELDYNAAFELLSKDIEAVGLFYKEIKEELDGDKDN